MTRNPLLITALILTAAMALWGVLDTASLASFSEGFVQTQFSSRGWFIMLISSFVVFSALGLAVSPLGKIRLGEDHERPQFSTISWLTMLFAAGMGVGLLFYGATEPLTHFSVLAPSLPEGQAARYALFITNFNWAIHAWSIYAVTALAIAYFSYRKKQPGLISTPIRYTFRRGWWVRPLAWTSDLLAIYAIAIGLAGSLAIGVFQVQGGVESLFGLEETGGRARTVIFVLLVAAFLPALAADLSKGMARLSNVAMGIAGGLVLYLLLAGPTHYLMDGIVDGVGVYVSSVVKQSFSTYPFFGPEFRQWFNDWTLNYMVWWIAWAPFVGVFVARISRGRTIREFLIGVIVVPSLFSFVWFGVFGGIGFHAALNTDLPILEVATQTPEKTTFYVLETQPLRWFTASATVLAAFLFLVTSVVSAAFVLAMFSTGGDENPPTRIKLTWGVILAALGLAMMMTGDLAAVRNIIALGAIFFVFIMPILIVGLVKTLKQEEMS